MEFIAKKIYRNKRNNQITAVFSKKDFVADPEIKNMISIKTPKKIVIKIHKEDFD